MRYLGMILVLALAWLVGPVQDFAAAGEQLEKVVALSRHGVRAPTQSEKLLQSWSQREWPQWPVPRGDLTDRGARLVSLMWANLAKDLRALGTLPADGCPLQKDIFLRADTDERTRATAAAIMEGLAPNCGLGYAVLPSGLDPLFHPVKAGLYRYDAIHLATDILNMTKGGFERIQDEFSGALNLLNTITGSPAPALCARFALMPRCQISDLPTAISISPDGTTVRIVGSLGIASSLAEIFLLEYGEWPNQEAGWGQVNGRVLAQTLPIHSKIFDIVNRAPVVAWANGASLLSEMGNALFGEHEDPRANQAKFVAFIGHDTNIANVGGILQFFWQASGYPPNDIPPAGVMLLELWNIDGEKYVKARFLAQSPATLHTAFDMAATPDVFAPKSVNVVTQTGNEALFTARDFKGLIKKSIADAPLARQSQPPYAYGAPTPIPPEAKKPN